MARRFLQVVELCGWADPPEMTWLAWMPVLVVSELARRDSTGYTSRRLAQTSGCMRDVPMVRPWVTFQSRSKFFDPVSDSFLWPPELPTTCFSLSGYGSHTQGASVARLTPPNSDHADDRRAAAGRPPFPPRDVTNAASISGHSMPNGNGAPPG
jgi:hypothetical protein